MAPSIHGSAGFGGTVTTATATLTLPASIPDGALGVATFGHSVTTATVSTVPTGWTEQANGISSTILQGRIYTKALGPADSGATVTLVWSGTGKVSAAVLVVAAAAFDAISAGAPDAGVETILEIPAHTPVADDCLLVHIGNGRNQTVTGAASHAGSWTLQQSVASTSAAPFNIAVIGTKPLTGGGGQLHAADATSATWSPACQEITWVVSVAPVIPPSFPRPQVHPSAAVIRAATR